MEEQVLRYHVYSDQDQPWRGSLHAGKVGEWNERMVRAKGQCWGFLSDQGMTGLTAANLAMDGR